MVLLAILSHTWCKCRHFEIIMTCLAFHLLRDFFHHLRMIEEIQTSLATPFWFISEYTAWNFLGMGGKKIWRKMPLNRPLSMRYASCNERGPSECDWQPRFVCWCPHSVTQEGCATLHGGSVTHWLFRHRLTRTHRCVKQAPKAHCSLIICWKCHPCLHWDMHVRPLSLLNTRTLPLQAHTDDT